MSIIENIDVKKQKNKTLLQLLCQYALGYLSLPQSTAVLHYVLLTIQSDSDG